MIYGSIFIGLDYIFLYKTTPNTNKREVNESTRISSKTTIF